MMSSIYFEAFQEQGLAADHSCAVQAPVGSEGITLRWTASFGLLGVAFGSRAVGSNSSQ